MARLISAAGVIPLLALGFTLTAAATASAAEESFTLSQAIEYAVKHNGELKAFREEKGIREAARMKAGLYANPVVELAGASGAISGTPSENNISLGLSQEFLTAGKREKRISASEHELEAYGWQIADRERLLTDEVTQVFLDYLLLRERLGLAERSIALNRQLLEVTRERLAAGDIPELEANLAKVEVARSEGKRADVERELQPVLSKLATLMGLERGEAVTFAGTLEARPFRNTVQQARDLALASRPDLKALERERSRGDAEIALAQAERMPNLTAGITFSRESTVTEVRGYEAKEHAYLIGFKLSVPIPVFGGNQAAIKEAQARRGSTDSRYLYARASAEREVEAAYARLTSSDKSLNIYQKEIIPQLGENLKLVQEAYRLGEVGILTVIEEQKKFYEVNDGYLAALHDREAALAKLETAVGSDLGVQWNGGNK